MNAFVISVAPEEFQRIIDENLGGLESVKAIVDDILIWGEDDSFEEATASHDKKLLALLKRFQRNNIKLNKEKFRLKKTELHTYGCGLTDKGHTPDPKKQDCIVCIPAPNNNDELRRLRGDVTYLSRFSEYFSTKSEPLRALLKNSNAFIWE